MQYIALLRGINVDGPRPLKMEKLRELFREQGFYKIETYIQSGNVIFESSEMDPDEIAKRIAVSIEDQFGYDVPVFVLKASEIKEAYQGLPFKEEGS